MYTRHAGNVLFLTSAIAAAYLFQQPPWDLFIIMTFLTSPLWGGVGFDVIKSMYNRGDSILYK